MKRGYIEVSRNGDKSSFNELLTPLIEKQQGKSGDIY